MKMVALIPARAGSKRIPEKNTKLLAGHPLIAYTIAAAKESGVFSEVIVSSEDVATGFIAEKHDAYWLPRPHELSGDEAPDIAWVRDAIKATMFETAEAFAILRPTSPFRTADTIRRAYAKFKKSEVHSLRAVEPAKYHPGKMWYINGAGYPMTPVCDAHRSDGTPWHSSPTQSLPPVYVQNSSLEMAWTYVVKSFGTIAGKKIAPFFTEGYEGFSLDYPEDWTEAERLIEKGLVELPSVSLARQEATPRP